ncbi:MAG: hypothetical protein RJB39_455 [Candidatus Parcubacteria bacterium]|jgi:thymidylate kinase
MARRIFTFEGGDGSGKSTLYRHLLSFLQNERKTTSVFEYKEPGGSVLGQTCRARLIEAGKPEEPGICLGFEASLFWTGRFQNFHQFSRELAAVEDGVVLTDRSFASSVAYQIYGRQSFRMHQLFDFMLESLLGELVQVVPDVELYHFFVATTPEVAAKRRQGRGADDGPEQFNQLKFQQRVFAGFNIFFEELAMGMHTVPGLRVHKAFLLDGDQSEHEVWVQARHALLTIGV